MKISKLKTAAFAVMLTLGFGSSFALADAQEDAILKPVLTYLAAMNSFDVPVLMAQFTDDGRVINENGTPLVGLKRITEAYSTLIGQVDFDVEHEVEEIVILGDEYAYVQLHGHGTLKMGTAVVPQNFSEVFVVRKVGTEYKIARYIFNTRART